jgi:activator of HSP90 ATPase
MVKTITQKVVFKNATPQQLYELYMDAKKHSLATGSPAKITNKEGATFFAHGNYITGKNLRLVPGKMIVQSWRSLDWAKTDLDSIFILLFEKKGNDAILHMTHANIPSKPAGGIKKGWDQFYWKPWKTYLAGKTVKKKATM